LQGPVEKARRAGSGHVKAPSAAWPVMPCDAESTGTELGATAAWTTRKGGALESYRVKATTSLGVALGAEPRDLAVSVHPVVGVSLAGEARDFALFAVRVVRQYFPLAV
jgi:hypothetical protein